MSAGAIVNASHRCGSVTLAYINTTICHLFAFHVFKIKNCIDTPVGTFGRTSFHCKWSYIINILGETALTEGQATLLLDLHNLSIKKGGGHFKLGKIQNQKYLHIRPSSHEVKLVSWLL